MTHNIAVFRMRTKVISGVDALNDIITYVRELNGSSVLVVTDPGIVKAGLAKRLEKLLQEGGVAYQVFGKVVANPPVQIVEEGAKIAKTAGTDLIIGFGGGSAIDVAKAISIIQTNGGSIKDYAGVEKFKNPTLPLIAISTTCGTGSEVTWSTVITDPVEKFKFAVFSNHNIPEIAIVDPTLLANLPSGIIASTGMDALTHAIESYVSVKAQPFSDALGIYAIEEISNHLRKAVHYQDNLEHLGQMAIASTMAGVAFTNGMLGLVHAMAHPLGGIFDIPHGIANAILLPYVMKFNLVAAPEKFISIAKAMGQQVDGLDTFKAAQKAFDAVVNLSNDIGIPNNLKEVGMDLQQLDKLAADTMKSGNVLANPRRNTIEDVKQIFLDAYHGQL